MKNYDRLDDADLIILLNNGNNDAFVEIYHRYWEILLNTAYQRLRSRADAEEVVQEIFVNLYFRKGEINPKSTLEAYLKTAIKFKVIDTYRQQQLHYLHIDSLISETALYTTITDEVPDVKEFKQCVLLACEKLPEKCRQVFIMFRFEELSHKEIAERAAISVSTVKKHLHKAMLFLREEFKGSKSSLGIAFIILIS